MLPDKQYDLTGLNILMIDDMPITLEIMSALLENSHAEVATSGPGPQVYDLLTSKSYNLVLLDFQMPEVDGFEILKWIRGHADPEINELPVVAITAKASASDRERILQAGCTYYFSKPTPSAKLLPYLESIAQSYRTAHLSSIR